MIATRVFGGLLLYAVVVWPTICAVACAGSEDTHYTNRREFGVPFDFPDGANTLTIASVILFVSPDEGQHWNEITAAPPPSGMFTFWTKTDGEYWCCLRTVDRAGKTSPPGPFTPELKMRVDTIAPVIDSLSGIVNGDGVLQISWQGHDANLDPMSVELQVKSAADDRWETLRRSLPGIATDGEIAGTATVQLPPAAHSAMVRVALSDLAGNVTQRECEATTRLPSPELETTSTSESDVVTARRLPPTASLGAPYPVTPIAGGQANQQASSQGWPAAPRFAMLQDLPILTPTREAAELFAPPSAGTSNPTQFELNQAIDNVHRRNGRNKGQPRPQQLGGRPYGTNEGDDQYDDEEEEDDDEDEEVDDGYKFEPILLPRGATRTEVGFVYKYRELNVPVELSDTSLANRQLRIRQALVPITFWYGITDTVSCYGSLPVRYLNFEESDLEFEEFHQRGGIGDVSAGVVTLLYDRLTCDDERYFALWSIDVTAPTGGDPFGLSSGADLIESGFWNFATDIEFRRSVGELETFGSIGYVHYLPETYFGVEVLKSPGAIYSAGVGWFLHENYWVEAELQGFASGNMEFDGQKISSTSNNVISAQFTLFTTTAAGIRIQPFLRAGLTDDADTAVFGVTFGRSGGGSSNGIRQNGAAGYGVAR